MWKENEAVRNWLSTKWLPLPEKCSRAFREEFHAAVNTNNGIEALYRAFKYTFLPRQRRDAHLSSVVTILINHFLPENYHKCLFLNYKQSGAY